MLAIVNFVRICGYYVVNKYSSEDEYKNNNLSHEFCSFISTIINETNDKK